MAVHGIVCLGNGAKLDVPSSGRWGGAAGLWYPTNSVPPFRTMSFPIIEILFGTHIWGSNDTIASEPN